METGVIESGPLLDALIAAQDRDATATRHPSISGVAHALIALVHELGDPLMWPAGSAAERLVGAAVALSEGKVEARDWSSTCRGRDVLIVAPHLVSAMPIEIAAEQARRIGANRVFACALEIGSGSPTGVDRLVLLNHGTVRVPDIAMVR